MRAGIQPGIAPAHDLDAQLLALQVEAVQVRDLQLAARRWLEAARQLHHLAVVEIQARHCVIALGLGRFFFQREHLALLVELRHAIALGVGDMVGKHAGACIALHGTAQQLVEIMAVEDVVAQHQGAGRTVQKGLANQKGLRQAVRAGLHRVLQLDTPLAAIAQQLLKAWCVLGGADNQNLFDPRQHQGGERVVDHRLVIHRQQLLADCQSGRVQAGAGAARQDDAFACLHCHGLQNLPQHALHAGLPVGQIQRKALLQFVGV